MNEASIRDSRFWDIRFLRYPIETDRMWNADSRWDSESNNRVFDIHIMTFLFKNHNVLSTNHWFVVKNSWCLVKIIVFAIEIHIFYSKLWVLVQTLCFCEKAEIRNSVGFETLNFLKLAQFSACLKSGIESLNFLCSIFLSFGLAVSQLELRAPFLGYTIFSLAR